MGHRTIKRVPLDFDHPRGETWPGYLRRGREFPPCPDCQYGRTETTFDRMFGTDGVRSTGLSREAYAIDSTFYAHQIGGPLAEVLAWGDKLGQVEVDMLFAERRVGSECWDRVDLPEPYELSEHGYEIRFDWVRNGKPAPTAAEVNAAQHGRGFMGHHDGINRMMLVRHRCKLLGIPLECATCKGRRVIATDEEYEAEEAAAEAWRPTEPPMGEGWQLWETTSEGSPVSPVFATVDELADWCADNASPFGRTRWTRDQWLRFASDYEVDAASLAVSVGGGPLTTLGTVRDLDGIADAS